MRTTEIKSEIQKVLDNIPEDVLKDILDFLIYLQHQSADRLKITENIRQILSEDKALLEKLAQWLTLKPLRPSIIYRLKNSVVHMASETLEHLKQL